MKRAIETRNLSGKELFMNRMGELPPSVRGALAGRQLKVSDHEFYAFVKVGGLTNIQVFTKNLNLGVDTNIHQGVVPNDMYFLATSIVLASSVGGAASDIANAVTLDYNTLDPILKNAKFTLKCGQDTYFEDCGTGIFQTDKSDLEPGEYQLENPKFLFSKQDVIFDIQELGAALPAETWVKVRVKGLVTTKK